jgi:hypothetical protein
MILQCACIKVEVEDIRANEGVSQVEVYRKTITRIKHAV